MKPKALYDLEVYPNYMLFGMKDLEGNYIQIERYGVKKSFKDSQISEIKGLIKEFQLIGFNSVSYDDVVLTYMLQGEPCDEIYHFSKAIVEEGLRRWDACMLSDFAKVAGDENFRETARRRLRHRINRK